MESGFGLLFDHPGQSWGATYVPFKVPQWVIVMFEVHQFQLQTLRCSTTHPRNGVHGWNDVNSGGRKVERREVGLWDQGREMHGCYT